MYCLDEMWPRVCFLKRRKLLWIVITVFIIYSLLVILVPPVGVAAYTERPERSEPQLHTVPAKATNIRFLKVHKAGSSTMQNLLFRFGLRYKLNIVVTASTEKHMLFKKEDMAKLPPGESYNIFALHTVYSKERFETFIPSNDSVNIGIVRYPPDRLISAAYYHRDVWRVKYLRNIPKNNFIHELIMHPDVYDVERFSQTRNMMGKEFGFPPTTRPEDHAKIHEYLRYLDTEFKLVLVMERFDESLVLMKRLLHWNILDILYLKANSHSHNSVSLNSTEIQMLRKTCFLDYALYDYFTATFNRKVADQGLDFHEEVEYFKHIVSAVSSFCKHGKGSNLKIKRNKWNTGFILSIEECKIMARNELKFVDQLIRRHAKIHHQTLL